MNNKNIREFQSVFMQLKENFTEKIARVLDRNYLKFFKTLQVPFLGKNMKEKRLIFANKYLQKDIVVFKGILWSDESRICLKISDKPPFVRRPNNKALDERYFISTIKHPISFMV